MDLLLEKPCNEMYFMNRKYSLQCSFDNVLEVHRLYKEESLTDLEKAEQALKMLVKSRNKIRRLSRFHKIELMNHIYKENIELPVKQGKSGNQKIMDFHLDSEYIYASFRSDYGIDLIKEQGKMHWKEFIYLFQGLSDHSKMKEIMKIRKMDIPAQTKHNSKQIQNIIELKSYYGLPVEGGGGQSGLDALFGALEQAATNGR